MKKWLRGARDILPARSAGGDVLEHAGAAMEWLCRAQDAGGGRGVARSYSLRYQKAHGRRGWLAAYPETTGYIIPTFFDYAEITGNPEYRRRAIEMARWESEVQLAGGAVQGGVVGFKPTPAIFNTGQVLFGWARSFQECGDELFLDSARRAAEFLVEAQDSDGAWRRHGSKYARAGVNLYDARTAWGLLQAFSATKDETFKDAAVRNLNYVISRQHPNGWFPDCCLDDDQRPLLHTLAYTMEGLIESGILLGDETFVASAKRAADALLTRQRGDGSLAGRFDMNWQSVCRWSCLTGDAQTALVWLRLYERTKDDRYFSAGRALNRFVMRTQDLLAADEGIRGGVKGSHPIWAEYGSFEYLNWAAKFLVDALLLEHRLGRIETPLAFAAKS